jgi:hypothetical protein
MTKTLAVNLDRFTSDRAYRRSILTVLATRPASDPAPELVPATPSGDRPDDLAGALRDVLDTIPGFFSGLHPDVTLAIAHQLTDRGVTLSVSADSTAGLDPLPILRDARAAIARHCPEGPGTDGLLADIDAAIGRGERQK